MNYNKYMSPEDIAAMEEMARVDDPMARIESMQGLQGMANSMRVKGLPTRDNGRVVGAINPLEAAGGIAQNLAGANMNKSLADKYGSILDANNTARGNAAAKIGSKYLADALRRNQMPGVESLDYAGYNAVADQIDPY